MRLVILSGPNEGQGYEVDKAVTLGRDPSNDIVLPDRAVSLVHCQIYFEDGRAFIKDLGSTNGLRLNGERIISSELEDGDGLFIGKNKIRIELPELARVGGDDGGDGTSLPTVLDTVRKGRRVTEREEAATVVLDARPRQELSGNIFGSVTYFLKRKIADGGMGSVYEAEQFGAEGFIKKVAIKTILPSYVKKEKFVSAFVGEAKLVANLVHQNIVQIHQLGRHEDGYYIAMEYIDGVNLCDFLNRHRRLRKHVPVEIATFIVSRICRGLEYAHNKRNDQGKPLGLVHRDVSPNNIMITREGEVKLTDFGVAKAAQFMEDDSEYLVGSVEYMSPEQAACEPVDGRSDLFSLGLIYYELLTGVRVFLCENDDIDATVERVIGADIADPGEHRRGLPRKVAANMMRCLEKRPDDRFQTAGELAASLEQEMYGRGYGPTIVALAKYVEDLYADSATR